MNASSSSLTLSAIAELAASDATRRAEAAARSKASKADKPAVALGAIKTDRGSRVYGNAGTALPGGFSRSFVLELLLETRGVSSAFAKSLDAGYSSTFSNIRARGSEIVVVDGLYRFKDARGEAVLSSLPADVAAKVREAFFSDDFGSLAGPETDVLPGEAPAVTVAPADAKGNPVRVRRSR